MQTILYTRPQDSVLAGLMHWGGRYDLMVTVEGGKDQGNDHDHQCGDNCDRFYVDTSEHGCLDALCERQKTRGIPE